jgi:hypothetical protein
LASTGPGPYTFTRPLYIGRGVPNTWIAPGQTMSVGNLTNSFDVASGSRSTYGVAIAVTGSTGARVVRVSLSGSVPSGAVSIQLPIFLSVGVSSVTGGTYNSGTHTVTASSNTVTINLAG